jgi:tetratricopeptide (TPR) repeat protein
MGIVKWGGWVLAMGMFAHGAYAQDTLNLGQAEQLLRSGQGEQAYEALLPYEFTHAGEPDYDYLLGASALESGHADRATLALERALAVTPNHGAARLDIGRAYFALGDMQRAREQLLLAQKLNPPATARAVIDQYLAAIKAKETAPATRATAYVEVGAGNDSNVTQGPTNNTAFLPAFGVNFTMNEANQKKAADFGQLNLGAEVTHKLDDSRSLYAGIDAKWRGHNQTTNYDYANTDLRGGMQWAQGRDTWRAGLGFNDYSLAQQAYRQIISLSGEFRRNLTPRQQLALYGQYSVVHYVPEEQRNNDVNQWIVGGGWTTQLQATMPTLLNVSAYLGQEIEAKASLPRVDGDKDFVGFRAAMQWAWRADLDLVASTGVQSGTYQRTNLLYQTKRADTVYEAAVSAVWRCAPAWSVKPQLSWLRNNSNLSVNDYERVEAAVVLRRDF